MINSMMKHSFEDNAGIRQLIEILKIRQHMHFCSSCFSVNGFIQIRFGVFEFSLFLFYK